VPPTTTCPEKRVRVKNIFVDHIVPIVDPAVGFVSWDSVIDRMFCDSSNLQLLCRACHKIKSQEEIEVAKARRAKQKLGDVIEDETFTI
jgi:5-methylcytosine-specific restriction endonuclease McrA